jgi:hypothetical protein
LILWVSGSSLYDSHPKFYQSIERGVYRAGKGAAMVGKILFGFGLLLLVAGLIWAAQGSGYFPYPAASFMIDQRPWIFRGAITAACGVALLLWSRRI